MEIAVLLSCILLHQANYTSHHNPAYNFVSIVPLIVVTSSSIKAEQLLVKGALLVVRRIYNSTRKKLQRKSLWEHCLLATTSLVFEVITTLASKCNIVLNKYKYNLIF